MSIGVEGIRKSKKKKKISVDLLKLISNQAVEQLRSQVAAVN